MSPLSSDSPSRPLWRIRCSSSPGSTLPLAAGHHQSLERREAHRGVDAARLALGIDFDRAEGAAGAELAADQVADVWISGRDRFAHVLVVEAVAAKAAQALLAPGCRDGVGGGGFAETGVEGGVEAGTLLDGAALQLALQPVDGLHAGPLCSGAKGTRFASSASTCGLSSVGALKWAPPCTIR